jgi:Tfp pilus assembly protein PilZ
VSDAPYRLSATIRSRCQRIELRPPPQDEARAWLLAQGLPAARVDQALALSDGHPGEAQALLSEGGLELREAVQRDLDALAARRAALSETVKAWLDDRPQERLAHAASLARARSRERLLGGEADPSPNSPTGTTAPTACAPSSTPRSRPICCWVSCWRGGANKSDVRRYAFGFDGGHASAIFAPIRARASCRWRSRTRARCTTPTCPSSRVAACSCRPPKRYSLGDEVFILLTLLDDKERLPVAGKVIWITPAGAQGNRTAGIGVQFNESAEGETVRGKIETSSPASRARDKPTHTM